MPQQYELNLRDYWSVFIKRKWIIILAFLAVFAATAIYTNLQPFLYKSTAVIKIEPITNLGVLFQERFYLAQPPALADYARQITSSPIIEKAVRDSGLLSSGVSQQDVNELCSRVAVNLSTRLIENSNLIEIELASSDAKEAAIMLNKIIEVLKIENLKQKNQQVRNAREFIEKELDKVSAKLSESESRLNELTIKGIGGIGDAILTNISELETKYTELATKFTKSHPNIVQIEEKLADLKKQLTELPREEFEFTTLRRDYKINETLYNYLRGKFQEAQIKEAEKSDNIIVISPAVPTRRPFSPNKLVNYFIGIVLGMIFGISTGLVIEHLDTSIGKIEDLESVTRLNVIGVIPYFAEKEDFVKVKLKTKKTIFNTLIKTEKRTDKLQEQLITRHKETSVFLEAFRILGANVQVIFGEGGKIKGKCILITSSNPQEGKSIIASNLSVVMAQMGYKAILLDMDLRRSTIHKIFGLAKKEGGITDILAGRVTVDSAVRSTTDLLLGEMDQEEVLKNPWIDNIHLLTAGSVLHNAPYLLNTDDTDKLIKGLKEKYDVIIMDSSPVLAVSDTSILVPKIDGVILVYRVGVTSKMALLRAKMQLESARGRDKEEGIIKGIILNNVTPESGMDSYYYYQGGGYYREKK